MNKCILKISFIFQLTDRRLINVQLTTEAQKDGENERNVCVK